MTDGRINLGESGVWWGPTDHYLWAANGRVSLPDSFTQEEAEANIARYDAGEFFCAGCKDWHVKPHVFQRFAGLYCASAAEKYKESNSRRCGLCGRPIWDCYC